MSSFRVTAAEVDKVAPWCGTIPRLATNMGRFFCCSANAQNSRRFPRSAAPGCATTISPIRVEIRSTTARGRYARPPPGINPVMNRIHPYRRLGALTLLAVAAAGLAAGCTDDDNAPATAAAAPDSGGAEPKTVDGARAAAQTVFDRFSGGDFAGAWDMYTQAGKQAISQADYVELNNVCSRKGIAIQLT